MRISDWSSDVCLPIYIGCASSSDITDVRFDRIREHKLLQPALVTHCPVDCRNGAFEEPVWHNAFPLISIVLSARAARCALRAFWEMGRAACRERVCSSG